jgi:Ca2+-binding RTX toxin-like protein
LSVSGTQYTNYDAAIESAMNAFATNGKLAGANNVSYFLTDGEPTAWVGYSDGRLTNNTLYDTGNSTATYTNANINPTTTDAGLEDNEVGSNGLTWTQFLNNNDVNSYAIGFGGASTAQVQLAPIAYNGTGLGSDPAGNVLVSPSLSDLTNVLLSTVPSVVNGSLLTGTTPGLIGADGGFVSSLSANGKVYTWDQSTDTFSAPGATSSDYSWDTSTNTVSIYMTSGGKFEVMLDTGAYKYWAPTSGTTDVIGFTLKDNDGDTSSGTLNLVSSNTKIQTLIGTSGDDVLIGNDGADSMSGGAGNDTLVFDAADTLIDGGSGMDTLILTSGTDINFSALGDIIHNIEVIDLTQNGAHKLNGLTVQDVFDMTDSAHTLTIFGDSADTITLVNPADPTDTAHKWTLTAENVIENGHTLDIYKSGDNSVTLKIEDTTVHTIA